MRRKMPEAGSFRFGGRFCSALFSVTRQSFDERAERGRAALTFSDRLGEYPFHAPQVAQASADGGQVAGGEPLSFAARM